jgi:hypothetical protein
VKERIAKAPPTLISNQGGADAWIINESGLYSLILTEAA